MKAVIRASRLDKHDKSRFVELAQNVDADAEREAEYLAAVFNMGFVRKACRLAYAYRNRRRRRK
jgi:hypothetical protein